MSFNVRCFGHRGIVQLPVLLAKQFSSDAVYQLAQPYEWSAVLVANGATPAALAPQATPDATLILRVEVPDGSSIRYEINPPNRTGGAVSAGNTSPILSGINQFAFGASWSISIVDAASFP